MIIIIITKVSSEGEKRCMLATSSGTAVTKDFRGNYVLAVTGGISRLNKEGLQRKVLPLNTRILDLSSTSNGVIYGVGDNGIFIRSLDWGETWVIHRLPTSMSIWSISCSDSGAIITHGQHCIYVSTDFGQSFQVLKPFSNLTHKPTIRCLCLKGNSIYIGTKIHHTYGGVWELNLTKRKLIQIKKENNRMVSSMQVSNGYLITASGSCKGKKGTIDFCSLDRSNEKWERCNSDWPENCYLDISEHDGILYTTTSMSKDGNSRVFKINLNKKTLAPCGVVKGHGWRIVNDRDEFIVAGLYETLYSRGNSRIPLLN